jgi:hypothetical protein
VLDDIPVMLREEALPLDAWRSGTRRRRHPAAAGD